MQNLPVHSLDFDEIKNSFKEFIKDNPDYKDWNFESSGINTLLNILAYNTHYIGFYVKMLMDESFSDSAHTREALLSIAKRTGYIPKGRKAAKADVVLKVTIPLSNDSPSQNYTIEATDSNFSSVNSQADRRIFSLTEDLILYDRVVVGQNAVYTSPVVTIFEGTFEDYRFVVNSQELNQRFIIRDRNIDITTLQVDVQVGETTEQYNLASDIFDLNGQSKVFFVTTDENGFYQVFFGDGVFGLNPPNGAVIHCKYISTNGPSGNGAKQFTFNLLGQNVGGSTSFSVTTGSPSSGGLEAESVESLRFSIPHHYRRQNRVHTETDYRAVLLSEFRNIDSINVWGGEKNAEREYGKIFVSIKPRYADALTSASKTEIKNSIVSKYGSVGTDVVFIDPNFIETDIHIFGKINPRLTNESLRNIESSLVAKVSEYNDEKLNRFETMFSDLDLLETLRLTNQAIVTLYSQKTIRKKIQILHGSQSTNRIDFSNQLMPNIKSNIIIFNGKNCHLIDSGTDLFLVDEVGTRQLRTPSGNIDFHKGVITFTLPKSSRVKGFEKEQLGVVEFTAIPKLPDISTSLNNIVRISQIKVTLST